MTHRPDLPAAELRRAARDLSRTAERDHAAMTRTMHALLESPASPQQRLHALLGRRRFLQIGGFAVATSAVIAACGGTEAGGVARVGDAPSTTALPDPMVNDVVLLRTASSVEHSAIAVYDLVVDDPELLDPALRPVVQRFRDDHAGHAALFERLTREAGGEPWTCGNPRIDEFVVTPILRAITGAAATTTTTEIAPSDDPRRDVLHVAHAFEELAGSTYQALVQALSQPSLRGDAIVVGSHEVRHAALLAIAITGAPEGYFAPSSAEAAEEAAAPTTTASPTTTQDIAAPGGSESEGAGGSGAPVQQIPPVYAVAGQYGSLGGVQLVVGSPDESGNRTTVNLETPSLNTFVYEYLGSC